MKPKQIRGASPSSYSRDSILYPPDSRPLRQNQGRKFDGVSGARAPGLGDSCIALLAPSASTYGRSFAFSTCRRRRLAVLPISFCERSALRDEGRSGRPESCARASHDV
jgi:hypothetical protein